MIEKKLWRGTWEYKNRSHTSHIVPEPRRESRAHGITVPRRSRPAQYSGLFCCTYLLRRGLKLYSVAGSEVTVLPLELYCARQPEAGEGNTDIRDSRVCNVRPNLQANMATRDAQIMRRVVVVTDWQRNTYRRCYAMTASLILTIPSLYLPNVLRFRRQFTRSDSLLAST